MISWWSPEMDLLDFTGHEKTRHQECHHSKSPLTSPMNKCSKKCNLPSGKLTWLWKITIFIGKTHYKWQFSIAMLDYQRVNCLTDAKITFPFQNPWQIRGKNNKHMKNLEKITCQHGNSPYDIIWLVVSLEHFFIFRYIEKNNSNWRTHIFQRGRSTTNQIFLDNHQ